MKKLLVFFMISLFVLTFVSCVKTNNVEDEGEILKETEPEVTVPEVIEPEVTEPEVTEPEVTEPEVVEPEVTEPEVVEPEVTEPEVVVPEVTEPEVVEPEVVEPEVVVPEVVVPEVTEPEVTEPAEEEIMERNLPELPEKRTWDNFTFGKAGDKTVAQQRQEIQDAMTRAINTVPEVKYYPEYNPTQKSYEHIEALTYETLEYKGMKTKTFAYIGFPENASTENPVPAVVLIHGGGGHPYAEWVKRWNNKGYAAIAMETTGCFPALTESGEPVVYYGEVGNDGKFEYDMGEFAEEGYTLAPKLHYPDTYTEVDEQWAYHAISQIIIASNVLRADGRVDSDSIGITGISWGGTLVPQVVGYDNRYTFAIPIYGAAYMGDEQRPFANFDKPYVDALWAAERNLDNADGVAFFWFNFNDDNNFGVPSYVYSYVKTYGTNKKNMLLMKANWGHSHESAWSMQHSYWFADWVTKDDNKYGFITYETQPTGREVSFKIRYAEGRKIPCEARVWYITEPMEYELFDKWGNGKPYVYLTSKWKNTLAWLEVDSKTGTVSGTIPNNVKGYYVTLEFNVKGGQRCESSSVFVNLD